MAEQDLSRLSIDKQQFAPRSTHRRRALFAVIVLAIVAAAALYAVGVFDRPRKVEVTTAQLMYPAQAQTLLNASGYVVAQRKAAVASKVTGRLMELLVEEGSRVRSGQVIARLDSEDVRAAGQRAKAEVQVARHNLDQARARLANAQLTYERRRKLVEDGIVSRSEFDAAESEFLAAEAAVAAAEAGVHSARASLAEVEVQLEYTLIRAPFDAVVLTKNADIGDIVTPIGAASEARASVVNIADLDSLQVEADVSEGSIGQVHRGQPCSIQLDALPRERFRGRVHMIVPTAERSKAAVLVKVAFVDNDPRILPEMSAKVAFLEREVSEAERQPVLVIPAGALVDRGAGQSVVMIREGRAAPSIVQTGMRLGDRIVISSGLEEGDQVVLDPGEDLPEGTRVEVQTQ
jgi:RND family efflux transporter MFP subunit